MAWRLLDPEEGERRLKELLNRLHPSGSDRLAQPNQCVWPLERLNQRRGVEQLFWGEKLQARNRPH